VEAAHGGRGNASSHDRSGGFGGGPRRGVSRHSEYRGMDIFQDKLIFCNSLPVCNPNLKLFYSACYWTAFLRVMARPKGLHQTFSLELFFSLFVLSLHLYLITFIQDHMRKAGDVCFSEVYREGGGKLHSKSQLLHLVFNRLKPKKISIDLNLTGL
jgi:hypothetical protein